jgi:hypothetical protein
MEIMKMTEFKNITMNDIHTLIRDATSNDKICVDFTEEKVYLIAYGRPAHHFVDGKMKRNKAVYYNASMNEAEDILNAALFGVD